jgi:hypothetical protein
MCMAPGMTENPYNDRQTKHRLRCLEGKVNGADLSTVNDIFEMRSIAECSSKVKLTYAFLCIGTFLQENYQTIEAVAGKSAVSSFS